MKKAEAEEIAKKMAEEAFQNHPSMDEISLRHYLITEEARSGVDWHNHTTYQAMYMKTYRALQQQSKTH